MEDDELVALIDESADETYYRVGALVMRVRSLEGLHYGLRAVVGSATSAYGVAPWAELHGHEIFHGLGDWKGLHPRQRIAVYGSALSVIAQHGEAILIKGVHRPRFQARYFDRPDWNEHENALTYLIEGLDAHAKRAGVPMYLFADNCRFAAATIAHLRHFQSWGTWGYKGKQIEHIGSLQYRDSATTPAIQAADLVCYLNHRIKSRRDTQERAIRANTQLWARIADLVRLNHDWYP